MTEPLRDLLDRLANEQPPAHVEQDTFGRGRRAHRRGLALRAGAATGLVAVAFVAAGPVVGAVVDGADTVGGPAAGERSPAVPAELYPVPDRLASFHEDGFTWHPDVRADGLDIGTTAAVFPVRSGAVMAVSAVDGRYRGLELPGFDDSSYFRFDALPVALSPDGTRLAWTWNDDVISGSGGEPIESGVRIADLGSGEVTDIEIPSDHGVYAYGFGWSPDGRYLTYSLDRATDAGGEVRGSRNSGVGLLDTLSGVARPTPLRGTGSAPAVSHAAGVAVSGGGYNAFWSAMAPTPEVRTYEGPFDSVAWSPSGGRTALASTTRTVAIGDERGVQREMFYPVEGAGRLRVLGWPDDSSFVMVDEATFSLMRVSADLEERETLVEADGIADLYQLSVAVDLLDEPTWDAPEPDWPTDWGALAWRTGLAAVALLAGVALVVSLRRRL